MNTNYRTASHGGPLRETLVAELTAVAYAVALRHGTGHSWLDLQLDLWKALDDTFTRWGQGVPGGRRSLPGTRAQPDPTLQQGEVAVDRAT